MDSFESIAGRLVSAGVALGREMEHRDILPVYVAWASVACSQKDGRIDVRINRDEERFVERLNESWLRLAQDFSLMDDDHRFLLGLSHPKSSSGSGLDEAWEQGWFEAHLMDDWDLAGAGAATGILGSRYGYPEFVMTSMSGDVVIRGTTWEGDIGVLALPQPGGVETLRRHGRFLIEDPELAPGQDVQARRWLASLGACS
jgi:hypothetical protein